MLKCNVTSGFAFYWAIQWAGTECKISVYIIMSPKESLNLVSILSVFLSYMNCQAHNQMEQYAEIIGKLIRNNGKKVRYTGLKGHSQLWGRADLDASFLTLKKVHLNQKSKSLVEFITKSASIRVLLCSIFDHCLKSLFLSVLFLIVSYYFFTFGQKHCGSRLQKNMKRRGGKREGAGWKKSPALAKITREINQK